MAIRADDLRHFSAREYLALCSAEPVALDRTELVNGVIYTVSPESHLHTKAVRHVDELLNRIYAGRSWSNGSVRLSDSSLWDPDVYVLRAGTDDTKQYPDATDVEVVVEICLSTRDRDLGDKLGVYAAEGIPVYWAIGPTTPGWAIVHRQPVNGVYHSIERIDLLQGYKALDADTVERLTHGTT